jgi:hypothetical protein
MGHGAGERQRGTEAAWLSKIAAGREIGDIHDINSGSSYPARI